jgi:hypothetical protein
MSSNRQLLQITGMVVGSFFGPVGAAIGGTIGGEIGGYIDGPPEGPRLGDLSAPQIEYGAKIPRFYGGPKWFEVSPLYMSEKRESSTVVGGKGGDSGVEQFSYTCDMLVRVCESRQNTVCEVIAVTGVEVDGELVWTALAEAGSEALANSASQEIWSAMAVQLGHEDQAPWSVYETAVGTPNANAYRGYLTVGFSDFLLAQGGQPRRIRIQAITAGTGSDPVSTAEVFDYTGSTQTWECPADGDYTLTMWGGGADREGGSTQTVVTLTEGQVLELDVGGAGSTSTSTGAFGGGDGGGGTATGSVPTGGAGASRARFQGGAIIAVAGGSGGVGSGDDGEGTNGRGGRGGGTDGEGGQVPTGGTASTGGGQTDPGEGGSIPGLGGSPGADGTGEDGGGGGNNTGGAGAGGGGGGYRGGGGGGTNNAQGGGGGGGSGYPPADTVVGLDFTEHPNYGEGIGTAGNPGRIVIEGAGGGWTPGTVDLRDILEYEATRCTPLTLANLDFSAAEGIPVECHVAIGTAAEAMQPLLTRFWFDLFSTDVLTLVRRGGDVEQTIAHKWTVAGQGGRSESFAGLIRGNDVEVAKKKAVTYSDVLKDGEADTRTGDREGVGTAIDTLTLNLNMRPSEAQGLADTATWDARIGAHTATVRLGARHGLLLQPGSVITLTDHQGNTYRCLVLRAVWNRWVWECEVRLDDPTVLSAAGIAVDLDQRALTVVEPPEATLYVLDIPLLRPQDDGPGEYVLATQTGRFRGIDVLKSSDDVSYSIVGEIQQRGTAGSCDSALPAYEGWGWDNSSVLTVTLDDGSGDTLSSATKAAIEASRSLNLCAVGAHGRWELIQFATATLITGTTYELTGILRNLFGTEWANATHEAGDSFALLAANGMARIPGSVSDLGQTRYYKAVPRGRSRDNVQAVSIECEQQALLPYAPVDVWNDAGTIRWNRRSRLEGAIGIDPPLGENTERYDAELYDGVTLEEDESSLTAANWTPGTDPSGLTVRVYQLSELIGRGHVAEKELT